MKFALRLTTLGVVFTVMFSVVGLRLWFIQVAEGPQIAQAAEEATWVGKTTYAARGDIYDRNGTLLATSRMVPAVIIDRTFVQPEQREPLIQELASIVGADPVQLDALYEEAGINGRFQVSTVSNETAYAINESLDDHYRVYAESVRNLGTPVFPRSLFEAMARRELRADPTILD